MKTTLLVACTVAALDCAVGGTVLANTGHGVRIVKSVLGSSVPPSGTSSDARSANFSTYGTNMGADKFNSQPLFARTSGATTGTAHALPGTARSPKQQPAQGAANATGANAAEGSVAGAGAAPATTQASRPVAQSQSTAAPAGAAQTGPSAASKPVQSASAASAPAPSGGIAAVTAGAGPDAESWWTTGSAGVQLQSLGYQAGSNLLPLAGTVDWNHGDVLVAVGQTAAAGRWWYYSLPVVNGRFSGTVTLPFSGTLAVDVGQVVDPASGQFSLNASYAYTQVRNDQPSLNDQQLALLQSWLINYNESSQVAALARRIVAPTTGIEAQVEAVSNWVSAHIAYNWPALHSNQVPWMQATATLADRVGVCENESALAAALLRSVGVPTRVIDGVGYYDGSYYGTHQWDEAWNGSHWVLFDPTWDQVYDSGGTHAADLPMRVSDQYFNLPAAEFDQTHQDGHLVDW